MIIEVDEYKAKIPGYDPKKSEDFHIESAQLANKDFIDQLKSQKYKRIILMAGGTASGKTEFAFSYLNKKDQLVYDGTLKDFNGFNVKSQKVQRYSKNDPKIKIVLVIPQDWIKAFEAFLKRDRVMRPQVFFETQIKSKLTVAKILMETKTRVEIYVSDVKEGTDKLGYRRIKMSLGRKATAKRLIDIAKYLNDIAKQNGFEIDINV
jgi:hypothetical protein